EPIMVSSLDTWLTIHMRHLIAACGLALLFNTVSLMAADWPQWRGMNRDGKSADSGLLKQWPPDGPKLVWKATGLGKGYGSVSVVGDRVYSSGDKDESSFV